MTKVLFVGESWVTTSIHVKGFDTFTTSSYGHGHKWLVNALESGGKEVTYLNNEVAADEFPSTLEEMKKYDVIVLSDIGSNTLLLNSNTFVKGIKQPDRLELVKQYVNEGGAFLMIGGYLSFTGIDCKARFNQTAIKDILPVQMVSYDDRVEKPQGVNPCSVKEHEILNGISKDWPYLLGYNKTVEDNEHDVIVKVDVDPLISVGNFGKGKSAVFTSDCSPHWGSPEFLEWESYDKLWNNIIDWLVK